MSELLKELMFAYGVSGDEGGISEFITKKISPFVDEVYNDGMGNLIAHKKSKNSLCRRLMFAAHMDEIGFMVNYIDDKGYVRIGKMGGINYNSAAFGEVEFKNGVRGVLVPVSNVAAKDYNPDSFYVDLGTYSKKESEKLVSLGMTCRITPKYFNLSGSCIAGRPVDNRIGCYMLIKTAEAVKDYENDTYFVFTVQEEIGVRGAKTSAYAINPDYGIATDIGGSGDMPGSRPFTVSLGKGPAIKIKDGMVICAEKMVNLMKASAEKQKIPYQLEVLESSGTDTCMLQQARGGCIAGAISVPTRYGHSNVETIDMKDVDGGIKILVDICNTKLD